MIMYHRKRSKRRKSSRKRSRSRARGRRSNPSRKRARSRRSPLRGRKHSNYGRVRSHKRRVNPRRKTSRRRRNPSFAQGILPNKSFVMNAVGVVAGFVLGSKLKPLYDHIPGIDASTTTGHIVTNLINVAAGSLLAVKMKNSTAKMAGVGLAASGIAEILTSFVPQLMGVDLSGMSLTGDGDVVRVGDEMVRVGTDLSGGDDELMGGESVYERI